VPSSRTLCRGVLCTKAVSRVEPTKSGGISLALPSIACCRATKGDFIMDLLNETIRRSYGTNYHWLKIQPAANSELW
jgi:hypothetical protein